MTSSSIESLSRRGRRLVLVASVATLAALCGCSVNDGGDSGSAVSTTPRPRAQDWTPDPQTTTVRPPATSATALPPQQSDVDRQDPDAVALAAMTLWFTWDTRTDSGPNDGAARTAPLLTPEYARTLTSGAPQSWPGGDWMRWRDQSARLVATARKGAEPTPPATATTAYAQVVVDQAVTRPDGTVVETVQNVVDVKLTRGGNGWEVASVRYR
ncbi:hypothetical protein IU444_28835 [Nocardia farcinica]|uniref:hypothetical protein n=1 Tax=Nocardia farcinica TaxID=37329 RepID=UPI00189447B4|nr:hypothetical protein [Nocardia farcinica]MBF6388137.1 hypothetical protein [Nocardia farcinica]UEX26365.1 hypothetical protein LMJ57_30925 [Nocardia farcinica]